MKILHYSALFCGESKDEKNNVQEKTNITFSELFKKKGPKALLYETITKFTKTVD